MYWFHRVFASKYDALGKILDVGIANKISSKVLDICVKGIHSDWTQYLTHLSLKLIAQTLRVDDDERFVQVIKYLNINELYESVFE